MAATGGKTLLHLLKSQDIEYIFCSPGSEWTPVWDELSQRFGQGDKSMKYINCRHESTAVGAAIGYSKTTGHLPAVLLHTGVGILHAAMDIRNAYIRHIPMIIFCAEDSDHGKEAIIPGPGAHWIMQLSDIGGPAALIRPYVKWSNTVRSKDYLVDSVYRACHIARTPPEGPVFISVIRELLYQSLPEIEVAPASPVTGKAVAPYNDLERAADQLLKSERPIIISDDAGKNTEAASNLTELVELLGIPVFEGKMSQFCNLPRNHPMRMDFEITEALNEADTVFVIGSTAPWYPPTASPSKNVNTILLDDKLFYERIPYWGYRIDLLLNGDIEQSLSTLISIIRAKTDEKGHTISRCQSRFEKWQLKHDQFIKKCQEEAEVETENKPISPKWLFHSLNKLLPTNSLIIEETILHSLLLRRYLAEPEQYVRALYGGLGIGLSEAVGTKLMVGDRPVIFLVGDGTFNYNPVTAGLGMCQEYDLPILIIILNNGGYSAMSMDYHRYFPEGWAAVNKAYLGVNITPPPDYSKLAEAFGGYGEKVEEPLDIEPAVRRALEQLKKGKLALLDIIVSNP